MNGIDCITRKWGSSLGIVIPKEIVEMEHLKPNEKICISIRKATLARQLWKLGPLERKEPTQRAKDELRAGW